MDIIQFAGLSQVLTGYGQDTILPQDDTQHMAQEYLDTLNTPGLIPAGLLEQLTNTWIAILANPSVPQEQQVQEKMMNDPQLGRLSQNIIYLWYLGIWYDLLVPAGDNSGKNFVVSSKAYKNSLVWETMGAHPMGYSEGNFGYWNSPPAGF